jgi:ribose 1,5-bisphosphokinase PhnN
MQPGERWIAHIPEAGGHVAVIYMGVAPSLVIPEGGGEDLVIPQARVLLPDDREVFIVEAALVRRVEAADEPDGDAGS